MRIIIVPQLKIAMRYTEWWADLFYKELCNRFCPAGWGVILLEGGNKGKKKESKLTVQTLEEFQYSMVEHELKLIEELKATKLHREDIILCLDACTPGIVASYLQNINVAYRPKTIGFCHGSSFNTNDMYKSSRWAFDLACLTMFDLLVVATQYHAEKLIWAGVNTNIIVCHGLPDNPFYTETWARTKFANATRDGKFGIATSEDIKGYQVAIVDRYGQKRNAELLSNFEHSTKHSMSVREIYGQHHKWIDYADALSDCDYMLITTSEETYGYQVRDALHTGVIPICPDRCCFREVVHSCCIYKVDTVDSILDTMHNAREFILNNNLEKFPLTEILTTVNSAVESFFTDLQASIIGLAVASPTVSKENY